MPGDQPDRSGSGADGLAAQQRGDERFIPSTHVREARETPPGEGRARAELPSGENRFPDKYGVREDELPRAVADHAVLARRYGEAAGDVATRLEAHLASPELRNSKTTEAMQQELLRVRYAGLLERFAAITEARVAAVPHAGADQAVHDQVHPSLVVAQTIRDLADDEVKMETVLEEGARHHLQESDRYAFEAEQASGPDQARRDRAVGFRAEVLERLAGLEASWATDNPGWVTGQPGALSDYREAVTLYRAIGDREAAARVQRLIDDLTPGQGQNQEVQGS